MEIMKNLSRMTSSSLWLSLRSTLGLCRDHQLCDHLCIGSSKFERLLRRTLHPNDIYLHAKCHFDKTPQEIYEDYFEQMSSLELPDAKRVQIHSKAKYARRRSERFPFLRARPDFLIEYSEANGPLQRALVEVKSTKSPKSYAKFIAECEGEGNLQLKSALNIFGMDKGFLVLYHPKAFSTGNEADHEQEAVLVNEVGAGDFLSLQAEQIIDGYSVYIQRLISWTLYGGMKSLLDLAEIRQFVQSLVADSSKPNEPLYLTDFSTMPVARCLICQEESEGRDVLAQRAKFSRWPNSRPLPKGCL